MKASLELKASAKGLGRAHSTSLGLLLDLLRAGSALSGPVRRGGTGPKSPQGRGQGGPRVRRQHRRCCRRTSAPAHGPAGQEARRARLWGALLFGYFLLGTQEKVTRSRERAENRQGCRLPTKRQPAQHQAGSAIRAASAAHSHVNRSDPLARRQAEQGRAADEVKPRRPERPDDPTSWRAPHSHSSWPQALCPGERTTSIPRCPPGRPMTPRTG